MNPFSKRMDNMSDSRLLDLYVETGDMAYYGELYNRYLSLIYGLCLKYLGRMPEAEDAVMQIFEDTSKKIGRFEVREFRTWIYSVARNHCLQILRKKRVEFSVEEFRTVHVEYDDILHLLSDGGDEAILKALQVCLERLPEPQRVSVRLFFMDDKSYADIAEDTGYAVKSVKSYIQNGKRNLKICIEKQTGGK